MKEKFDHKSNTKELLSLAVKYQENSIKFRAKTNDEYRKKESELHNTFRISLDGLIVRIVNALSEKIENPNEKISYQISLSISFIRTHFIINDMILQGDLIEAFTLIRKNFESVTRLNEIDKSPLRKLLKKTPNVINIFGKAGKQLYPPLSEISHFGTPRVGELLTIQSDENGKVGPSIYPLFNENAFACYDRHAFVSIYFIFWMIEFLKTVYGDKYDSKKDEATFMIMMSIAEECGLVEKEPQ